MSKGIEANAKSGRRSIKEVERMRIDLAWKTDGKIRAGSHHWSVEDFTSRVVATKSIVEQQPTIHLSPA